MSSSNSKTPPRLYKRISLRKRVVLDFEELRCFLGSRILDLSPKGLRAETDNPIPTGTECRFEIFNSDQEPGISGVGTVIWSASSVELGTTFGQIGIRIDQIEGFAKERLKMLWRAGLDTVELVEYGEDLPDDKLSDTVPFQSGAKQDVRVQALDEDPGAEDALGEDQEQDPEELSPDEIPTEDLTFQSLRAQSVLDEDEDEDGDEDGDEDEDEDEEFDEEGPSVGDNSGYIGTVANNPTQKARAEKLKSSHSNITRFFMVLLFLAVVGASGYWWWQESYSTRVASHTADSSVPASSRKLMDTPSPARDLPAEGTAVTLIKAWEEEGMILVRIQTLRPVAEEAIENIHLGGSRPREVVKLFGAVEAYPEKEIEVSVPGLVRIRTGFHVFENEPSELRIVLDLEDENVEVASFGRDEQGILIQLSR